MLEFSSGLLIVKFGPPPGGGGGGGGSHATMIRASKEMT
jgi:hypothetical protein